jgi:O-antigen ligase
MTVEIGKYIHRPCRLFAVRKDAIDSIPVAALIVILFPLLVTNILAILLYLPIAFYIFFCGTKIPVTRDLRKTAVVMLTGVLIMAYSYDHEAVMNYMAWLPPDNSSMLTSMYLTFVICCVVFILGYWYSFTVSEPLSILGYAFLYQWVLVGLYFIVVHGFFIGNSLLMGNITIILLPYMYLVFDGKPKLKILFSLIVLSYLMLILCRTAFVAALIFYGSYYLYPYMTVNKVRYKLCYIGLITSIFIFIFIYLSAGFNFIEDASATYFGGKTLGMGRDLIWPELLNYIIEKPLLGYGINQDSGYLQSKEAILGYRALDSHNIYLETLLRGGILLLSLFLFLFYRIWESFYSMNSKISRIAASGFSAFLFVGAGLPIGIIDNIVLNTLLWFYWGVASGSTWIHNHHARGV